MGIKAKIKKLITNSASIKVDVSRVINKSLLDGKIALVIGGGTGIGLGIASALKDAGCQVIIAGRSNHNITEFVYEQWDVTQTSNIKQKFFGIAKKYGRIDIVVNSQGICPNMDFRVQYYEIDENDYEEVFSVNAKSVYFICQTACKYFVDNSIKGHILNIASTEGLKGSVVPYGLSKTVVVSLTEGLGKRFAQYGIVVNGIAPGATATSMLRKSFKDDYRIDYIPSKRATLPEEIGNMAVIMVSDAANQMNGTVVTIDGGEHLK